MLAHAGAPACLARHTEHVLIAVIRRHGDGDGLRPLVPAPPDPAALGDIDPEVRALVEEHTAAVNQERSDPNRWGRLAMAYEANGLLVEAENAYAVAIELDDRSRDGVITGPCSWLAAETSSRPWPISIA